MIYLYNRAATVSDSEFVWVGESGIVSVGTTDRIDGTKGDQPRGNQILRNLIHEVGIFGKQTAGYVQAMSCQTTLKYNVRAQHCEFTACGALLFAQVTFGSTFPPMQRGFST